MRVISQNPLNENEKSFEFEYEMEEWNQNGPRDCTSKVPNMEGRPQEQENIKETQIPMRNKYLKMKFRDLIDIVKF